jgi:hypothetical protein
MNDIKYFNYFNFEHSYQCIVTNNFYLKSFEILPDILGVHNSFNFPNIFIFNWGMKE